LKFSSSPACLRAAVEVVVSIVGVEVKEVAIWVDGMQEEDSLGSLKPFHFIHVLRQLSTLSLALMERKSHIEFRIHHHPLVMNKRASPV
jgi:hypothetical protein